MRKSAIVKTAIIVIILLGVIIMAFCIKKTTIIPFDLAEYQWAIKQFPSETNVGEISDANIAIEKAKKAWIERFDSINGKPFNPINGRPIKVYFDENNDCWYIHGTLPPNAVGGVPNIIIQSNGDVLAIWHDQ